MSNSQKPPGIVCPENCANCHDESMPCLGMLVFMEADARLDLYRKWKKDSDYSNIHIAEESGLSEVSVSRFFAGHTKDTKVSTLIDILRVLLRARFENCKKHGGKSFPPDQTAAVEEIKARMQEQHDADRKIIDYLKAEVEKRDAQLLVKDRHLSERANFIYRKDRVITILSVLLGISVIMILSALLVDMFNPNVGFFWMEQMAAVFG